MGEHQFVDRYAELDPRYIKHKQEQYKHYKKIIPYTEELFWNKLIDLGWRKDSTTTECLVLVCSVCESSILKVVLKDTTNAEPLLNVEERKQHHLKHFCKATGKAKQE